MRSVFCLSAVVAIAALAASPQGAAAQGKFGIGIRSNIATPPNPNVPYGEPLIFGEQSDFEGTPYYGITAHGSLTLPKPPNTNGNGACHYRVIVRDVYHEASDTHAYDYAGAWITSGQWTNSGDVWWSGTFLTKWEGTPNYSLPAGTIAVRFALEVTVPDVNWTEVATVTGYVWW